MDIPAAPASARLVIHRGGIACSAVSRLVILLRWLQHLALPGRQPPAPQHSGVRIADLRGHEHFAAELPSPSIAVNLPAGTYHVTVQQGRQQRRYTVTLEPGAAFELHPHLTADPP